MTARMRIKWTLPLLTMAAVLLLCPLAFSQAPGTQNIPSLEANNVFTGTEWLPICTYPVALLPTNLSPRTVCIANDANPDCRTGGGTGYALCQWSGPIGTGHWITIASSSGSGHAGCSLPGNLYGVLFEDPVGTCDDSENFTYNPAPGAYQSDITLNTSDPSGQDSGITVNTTGGTNNFYAYDVNGLNGSSLAINTLGFETDSVGSGVTAYGANLIGEISEDSENATGDSVIGAYIEGTNQASGGTSANVSGSVSYAQDGNGISGSIIGSSGLAAETHTASYMTGGNFDAVANGVGGTITGPLYGIDVAVENDAFAVSGLMATLHIAQPILDYGGTVGTGPYAIATDAGSYPNYFGNGLILGTLTPGTSPVCPNGTNGALTTAGCSGGGGGTIGGSIAVGQLAGGTGPNTIGPLTDGTATWSFSGQSPLGLLCLMDDDCELAISDAAGDSIILGFQGIDLTNIATGSSATLFGGFIEQSPITFAKLTSIFPSCSAVADLTTTISDSTTNIVGATITGGGSYNVQAFCNGVNWVVGAGGISSGGAVTSVSNSDSTLTVSPTTGSVVASLNLAHANTWTATQTLSGLDLSSAGSGTFCLHAVNGVVGPTASDCGAGGGSVTAVTASSPLASSGGTAPNITLNSAVSASLGGTGINTSSSTGIPQVASGTWTVSTTLPNGLALGTPASGVATNLTGTATALNIGGNAATATNLSGTGTDYAPYQSASATTGYINAPTTNAHTFVYAWQPTGSAVAPIALDLGTYLASPPSIGSTTPAAGKFSSLTNTACSTAGLATTTSGGVLGCEAVPTWNQNTTGTAANLSGTQTSNYFYAAPNGSSGAASFRAMVAADVPTLNQSTTGNAATSTLAANSTAVGGITVTGTPAIGQVLTATSSSAADWAVPPGSAVTSVGNSDGTLTISPTTGTVIGSLNLGHANTWTALQSFSSGISTTAVTASGVVASTTGVSGGYLTAGNLGTATSSTNYSSNYLGTLGSYWTGSAAAADTWKFTGVLGSGSNPTSIFTLAHSGTSGAATVSIPYPTTLSALSISGCTSGQVVKGDGTGCETPTTGTVTSIATTSPITGGTITGTGTIGFNSSATLSNNTTGNAATATTATNLSGGLLGSVPYQSAASTTAMLSGPTAVNGVPQVLVSTPSGGAATAPVWTPTGIPPRFNTLTTDTILATDRGGFVAEANSSAIAVSLPQAGTTGFANNFVFTTCDSLAGTATITPATSTITYWAGSAGGYHAAATSLALTTGQCATIFSDNTNYYAIVKE